MPMGIKNAPAWFQCFMEETFRDFIERKVLSIYLDDTILHTESLLHHKEELEQIFEGISNFIKCSYNKSELVAESISFLGNGVSKKRIEPNSDRAACLLKREKPVTLKSLQEWLGVANYQPTYIHDYAQITK